MWPKKHKAQVDEQVLVMASSKKMVIVFIGSLLLVLASVWLVTFQEGNTIWNTVGTVTAITFGITMLYALFRLVKPKPAVIVNAEGFRDQTTSLGSKAFIRWTEVEELFLYDYMGQRYLGVRLRNPEHYITNQAAWKRPMLQANLNLVRASINIPQSAVNVYLEQLLTMMQRRWIKANKVIT